jgi:NAD(P)-dependent dehydrogenase (short-subunit alcohol dehydrogenase family)
MTQVAFITGGGRAIGKCIALRLARDGLDLAIVSPDRDELEETAAEIRQLGRCAEPIVADVTCEDQVLAAVQQTRRSLGRIDVLVNNAGIIGPTALVRDVTREEWDDVLAVNLTGAFLCCKAVSGEMIDRRSGKIVNISSIAGKIAYPLRSPYAASKWGLVGLSKSLAKELGPYNIQVNAVCPGPVEGPRMEKVFEGRARELEKTVDEIREEYVENSLLKRLVKPDDVAAMVAYLASSQGDNITGQAIEVSAGYAM